MPPRKSKHQVNATFKFLHPIEFITALYRCANIDLFERRHREWDNAVDNVADELLRTMYNRLSPFLQRELDFFFGLRHVMADQAFHVLAFLHPLATTVPEMLDIARCTDTSVFLQAMSSDTPESERVAECEVNLEETKSRLLFLLQGFYERAYQPAETDLEERSRDALGQFQSLYDADESRFISTFAQTKPGAFKKQLIIHVSVLNPYGITSTFTDRSDIPDYLRLGVRTESRLQESDLEATVDLFTKAISDKRRMEILRLLSKQRMYGQEIANRLQLTSAAVSYHMGFFFKLHLVHLEKQDNKVYFNLDPTRLAQLLNILRESLLSESK